MTLACASSILGKPPQSFLMTGGALCRGRSQRSCGNPTLPVIYPQRTQTSMDFGFAGGATLHRSGDRVSTHIVAWSTKANPTHVRCHRPKRKVDHLSSQVLHRHTLPCGRHCCTCRCASQTTRHSSPALAAVCLAWPLLPCNVEARCHHLRLASFHFF